MSIVPNSKAFNAELMTRFNLVALLLKKSKNSTLLPPNISNKIGWAFLPVSDTHPIAIVHHYTGNWRCLEEYIHPVTGSC
jgi:hypothetical protein